MGSQITIDFRNSPFNPSRGWTLRVGTEYANGIVQDQGVLDNTTYAFLKSEGRLTGYLPLGTSVLALALWGGRIDILDGDAAPIDQRFSWEDDGPWGDFLMTASSQRMRALKEKSEPTARKRLSMIAPQLTPSHCQAATPIFLAKENCVSRVSENLTLNSFIESGNLWYWLPSSEDLELRLGLGLGMSYTTPVGPLAVSVGFNPFRKQQYYESLYEFHISIGQF